MLAAVTRVGAGSCDTRGWWQLLHAWVLAAVTRVGGGSCDTRGWWQLLHAWVLAAVTRVGGGSCDTRGWRQVRQPVSGVRVGDAGHDPRGLGRPGEAPSDAGSPASATLTSPDHIRSRHAAALPSTQCHPARPPGPSTRPIHSAHPSGRTFYGTVRPCPGPFGARAPVLQLYRAPLQHVCHDGAAVRASGPDAAVRPAAGPSAQQHSSRVGRGAPRRGAAPRASAPRLKRAPRASAPRAPRAVSGPCCPGKRRVPVCKPEMDWRLRLQRAVTRYSLHR